MTAAQTVLRHDDAPHPHVFTRGEVGWVPHLEPLAEEELTPRHYDGLVDAARAKNDYFRLLARDPEVLKARTLVDKDIFYNVAEGLPRADRELAATAASRRNGCVFCASVHSRFAAHHSKRVEDVDLLLDEGSTPISASAGTRSWPRRSRSPTLRAHSGSTRSPGCGRQDSTTWRSLMSSTARRSSTGRTA